VTFYDGVTVLGSAPVAAGKASFSTVLLPSGKRALKAYYAGDGVNPAATSNVVTGSISANPSGGSFAQGRSLMAYSSVPGDFNNDGKADIALGSTDIGVFQVLLGNGDGTFRIGRCSDISGLRAHSGSTAHFTETTVLARASGRAAVRTGRK